MIKGNNKYGYLAQHYLQHSCIHSLALNCCVQHWTFTVVCDLCYRPQLATRLLAHKIQSPQEWEAMQALLVSSDLNQDLLVGICCLNTDDPGFQCKSFMSCQFFLLY